MVKNPRTPPRSDQLRPLNSPRNINVVTEQALPVAVIGPNGTRQEIVDIEDTWCIDDEWWREPIQRRYYRVALETGSVHTMYFDQVVGTWHEQGY
ncbi:hypothetical protein BH23CHL5_BH23CHL5_11610 [soil metagenome]